MGKLNTKTDLKICCPYCKSPFDAKMEADYEHASSEYTGLWKNEVTIDIYCSNCKKLVYSKFIDLI